ncbi:hypothetical protein SAMN04488696_0464 [Methanolobus profundi]|uniref:Uncharacterized protein n=1 Tax=Methanolobus profundi TaxID=487685 RepID=A0A1I4P5H8_9EURY|nr:hypothetical protein SAMN04488696_0464 [Methanolobus profundi]
MELFSVVVVEFSGKAMAGAMKMREHMHSIRNAEVHLSILFIDKATLMDVFLFMISQE